MATREPPAELFYAPEDLRPGAPRLYVWRDGADWRLEDEAGELLSIHETQSDAIEAARERSEVEYTEILVRGSTGVVEWLVDQSGVWEPMRQYYLKRRRADRSGKT